MWAEGGESMGMRAEGLWAEGGEKTGDESRGGEG